MIIRFFKFLLKLTSALLVLLVFLFVLLSFVHCPEKTEKKGEISYKNYHIHSWMGESGGRAWCTVKIGWKNYSPPLYFNNNPRLRMKRCAFIEGSEPVLVYSMYNNLAEEFGFHLLWLQDGKPQTVYVGGSIHHSRMKDADTVVWDDESCFLNLKTGEGGVLTSAPEGHVCLPLKDVEKNVTYFSIHQALKNKGRRLDLSFQRLKKLSDDIGQLAFLKNLNLQDNQLATLPPAIGRLTELETLNLELNQLESLPAEIGQLKKLKVLNLYRNNHLKSLPASLSQLTSLQTLDLRWTEVPEEFIQELRRQLPQCQIRSDGPPSR